MFPISTALHHKEYSIAFSEQIDLLARKWTTLGSCWEVSPLSAVYRMLAEGRLKGSLLSNREVAPGVYALSSGFVRVH